MVNVQFGYFPKKTLTQIYKYINFKKISNKTMQQVQSHQKVVLYDSKSNIDGTLPNPDLLRESILELFRTQSHSYDCILEALSRSQLDPIRLQSLVLRQILMLCGFIDKDGIPNSSSNLHHQSSTIVRQILEEIINTSLKADLSRGDASRIGEQVSQESGNEHNQTPIQVTADDNPPHPRSQTSMDAASRQREHQQQSLQVQSQGHGNGNLIEHNINQKQLSGNIIDDAQPQQQVPQEGDPQLFLQPKDQFHDKYTVECVNPQNDLKPSSLVSYVTVLLLSIYKKYEEMGSGETFTSELINCQEPLADVNDFLIQSFICCRVIIAVLFAVKFKNIKVKLDSETFNFIFINSQNGSIYFINLTHLNYYFKRQKTYQRKNPEIKTTLDALLNIYTFNLKLRNQTQNFEPWFVSLNCLSQTPLINDKCFIQLSQWNPFEDSCTKCKCHIDRNSWILDPAYSVLHSHLFNNRQKYWISVGDNIKLFLHSQRLYLEVMGQPREFMTKETFDDVFDPYDCIRQLKETYQVKKTLIEDQEAYQNQQHSFDQDLNSQMEQAIHDKGYEQQNLIMQDNQPQDFIEEETE